MDTWLIIILAIIGYSIAGFISTFIYIKYDDDYIEGVDTDKAIAVFFFWWVLLLIGIVLFPPFLAQLLAKGTKKNKGKN